MHKKDLVSSPESAASCLRVLCSSASLPWDHLLFEQRAHQAGHYHFPGFPTHLICLSQGVPVLLEQQRHGQRQQAVLQKGAIQIVPAGTESVWSHPGDVHLLHLLLTSDLLEYVADNLKQKHTELLNHFSIHDSRIEHILSALLLEVADGAPSGRLYGEGLAIVAAAHLLSTYSSTPKLPPEITRGLPQAVMRRIVSLMEERLGEDLGLTELAAEARLSPSYFARQFRRSTGLSPHQYLVQRRVERAIWLLQSTTHSLREIAQQVGFADQSHLTRHVRQFLGVTPKYIRDQSR